MFSESAQGHQGLVASWYLVVVCSQPPAPQGTVEGCGAGPWASSPGQGQGPIPASSAVTAGQLLAPAHRICGRGGQDTHGPHSPAPRLRLGARWELRGCLLSADTLWSSVTESFCLSTGLSALPKGQLPPGWGGGPCFCLADPSFKCHCHHLWAGLCPLLWPHSLVWSALSAYPTGISFLKASWPRARRISISEPGCEVAV